MTLLVLTRAVKIDQSYGIPESGIPEWAFVKKSYWHSLALTPTQRPRCCFFSVHISLRCPNDLNTGTGYQQAGSIDDSVFDKLALLKMFEGYQQAIQSAILVKTLLYCIYNSYK